MKPFGFSDELIMSSQNLSAHKRLELYAQQFWWRIQGAFDEDFLTVQKVLPSDEYRKLRDSYLSRFPSNSYTLRDLGSRFAKFVKTIAAKQKRYSVVYECACFDWARVQSFDAANGRALTSKDIASSSFQQSTLKLAPHVQLLKTKYPVHEVSALPLERHGEATSNTELCRNKKRYDKKSAIQKKQCHLVIYRYNERVYVKVSDSFEYSLLKKFEKGTSLKSIIKNISLARAERLQKCFEDWSAKRLLTMGKA